jgi:MscS family membrane protein
MADPGANLSRIGTLSTSADGFRPGRALCGVRGLPRYCAFGFVLVWLVLLGVAKPAPAADPLNRDSPQSAVFAFLQACHSKDYQRGSRYLDLRKLPANDRSTQGAQVAEQLAQILDNDTRFDEAELSKETEGPPRQQVASFVIDGKQVELALERVTLRPGVTVWLFDPESVDRIPRIAKASSDSPIQRFLPAPLVNWKLIDTPIWKWLALALLAVILAGLSRLAGRLTFLGAAPALKRFAPHVHPALMEPFLAPARLLLVALGIRVGIDWILPSPQLKHQLENFVVLLIAWALAWSAMKAVDRAIKYAGGLLHAEQHGFTYSVLPLTARVVKVTIAVVTAVMVLGNWGYNTTTIVAGLGVGGIAVALAAQKTIENLFGGIAVITDRPVMVGDFCKFADRSGTVEDIGLRSTRIRTPERTLVTVPNGAFSMMTLENLSRRDKTLFHVILNLRHDTSPDQIRDLLRSLTRILKQFQQVEAGDRPVRFVGVQPQSLDLEINVYLSVMNDDDLASVQEDIHLRLLDAVEAAGATLAVST